MRLNEIFEETETEQKRCHIYTCNKRIKQISYETAERHNVPTYKEIPDGRRYQFISK
jgi:hypothetical protein